MYSNNNVDLLPSIVRGPTWVSVDNQPAPLPGSTDVCLMQFQFPGSVNVHSIQFRNYYTHTLCIKSRSSNNCIAECEAENVHVDGGGTDINVQLPTDSNHSTKTPWNLGIKKKTLMPDPDYEDGSQSYFNIQANESVTSWTNVSSFIFILRQPSKRWKTFSIQEVEIRGTQNLPPPVQTLQENKESTASADGEGSDIVSQPNTALSSSADVLQRLLKVPQVVNGISDIVKLFRHFHSLDL